MKNKIEDRIEKIAKRKLKGSSHNWDHTKRVYNLALKLAKNKKIDLDVLKVSALLHDIEREKEDKNKTGSICHAKESAKTAFKILKNINFSKNKIKNVIHCIETHRFRKNKKPNSKEAKILYDADKLDALGAVGVARTFLWAAENKSKLYDNSLNVEEYKKLNIGKDGRIKNNKLHNPYFEFLLKLRTVKDKLLTEEAKKIAVHRHKFMEEFYKEFYDELEGKK